MNRIRTLALGAALALAVPASLVAQTPDKAAGAKPPAAKQAPKPKEESQAQLKKEAKISESAATATALAAVPGGKVKSHELEREKGKLIYSFDISIAGKKGIEEVAIDAMTGAMIEKVHEDPATEAKEAAADKKAAAKKPTTTPPVKKP